MKDLICLGDSMVFGYGVTRKERWTTLLDQKNDWKIFNCGANAQRTDELLARFPKQVLAKHPYAMFLLGGSNDLFQGFSVTDAIENLHTIISQAQGNGIKVYLATVLPFIYPFDPPFWAAEVDFDDVIPKRILLNNSIRALARETGSTLIDLARPFDELPEEQLRSLYLDELHCNAAGHRLVAEIISSSL